MKMLNNMMSLFFCAVLVLCFTNVSDAFLKTQYVDPDYSGGFTRDGSSTAPWATINAALSNIFTGTGDRNVINIAEGTYEEYINISQGNIELYGDYDGWPNWNRGDYPVVVQHSSSHTAGQLVNINISSGGYTVKFDRMTFQRANSKGGAGIWIDGDGTERVDIIQCDIKNFTAQGIELRDNGYDSADWDLYIYYSTIESCGGCGVEIYDGDDVDVWIGGFVYNFDYYNTVFDGNNQASAGGTQWNDGQLCILTSGSCGNPPVPVMLLDGNFIKWENCDVGGNYVKDITIAYPDCVDDSLANKTTCYP